MRGLLRCIYLGAQSSSITLTSALQAALLARYSETNRGRFIVGTSANGSSVSFSIPPGLSPADVFSAVEELIELYELTEAAAGASPSDAELFATMMSELQPSDSVFGDFTNLRAEGAS
jgi:hypothetical protein